MSYRVTGRGRNRRVEKYLRNCAWHGGGMMWDIGPYVRPSQLDRTVCFMSRLEGLGQTDHWTYRTK